MTAIHIIVFLPLLAALVAGLDVTDDGVVFLDTGAINLVKLVDAHHVAMRRNDHRLKVVDFLKLVGFGVGRAGHARELLVHAEEVLEGDRGKRLILVLDGDVFLRLDGLVQAVGPAPPGHQPAGELVDDNHFAVLHDVVPVAEKQVLRAQRRVQVVHQIDVGRLVKTAPLGQQTHAREQFLGVLMALGSVAMRFNNGATSFMR